jgi:hypothetical protein
MRQAERVSSPSDRWREDETGDDPARGTFAPRRRGAEARCDRHEAQPLQVHSLSKSPAQICFLNSKGRFEVITTESRARSGIASPARRAAAATPGLRRQDANCRISKPALSRQHGPPVPRHPSPSAASCDAARQLAGANLRRARGLRHLSRPTRRAAPGERRRLLGLYPMANHVHSTLFAPRRKAWRGPPARGASPLHGLLQRPRAGHRAFVAGTFHPRTMDENHLISAVRCLAFNPVRARPANGPCWRFCRPALSAA